MRPLGKIRSPIVVILLMIITFGIYSFFYYGFTFGELNRWRGQGWTGTMAVLFMFIPILNVVHIWLLPAYVGRAYAESGQQKPITGLSGFWIFVPFVGGIIWICVVQGALNNFWRSQGVQG